MAPGLAPLPRHRYSCGSGKNEARDTLTLRKLKAGKYGKRGLDRPWPFTGSDELPVVSPVSEVLQYYFSSCSPTFTQHAGVAALRSSQDCVAEMLAEYDQRRRVLVDGLASIPGVKLQGCPEGAYYVFPDLSAFGDSQDLARYLLDEHHIAVVDGG
ncbi:unnamed protein product, partial [Effrenium voratum]